MRTCIFCTSFLADTPLFVKPLSFASLLRGLKDQFLRKRLNRWLAYYSPRTDLLGAERLFIVDDGSRPGRVPAAVQVVSAEELPGQLPDGTAMFRFSEHLGRLTTRQFPGWWRSFCFASQLAEKYGFDKLIHIESDAFVLSHRMARYIKDLSAGWTCFYCPLYGFPETAIQVICRDAIAELARMWHGGLSLWRQDNLAEFTLPFTCVNRQFVGDRYGENLAGYFKTAPRDIDYVCQAHPLMVFCDRLAPGGRSPVRGHKDRALATLARWFFMSLYARAR
jgi:hypothetical protein